MSGILKTINRIKAIAPFREPHPHSKLQDRKAKAIRDAFDGDELLALLRDAELFKNPGDREILVASLFLTRRAIVRLTNNVDFNGLHLVPGCDTNGQIKKLEAKVAELEKTVDWLRGKTISLSMRLHLIETK